MSENEPCCAATVLRRVKKIKIGGIPVGISLLDMVFTEVRKLGLNDEHELKKELIKRVKIYNFISPNAEKEYADALYHEYLKDRKGGTE